MWLALRREGGSCSGGAEDAPNDRRDETNRGRDEDPGGADLDDLLGLAARKRGDGLEEAGDAGRDLEAGAGFRSDDLGVRGRGGGEHGGLR